jgi:Ribbon-helix-helix protein, copG family
MRSKLYTNTKAKIISARISDDEMENVKQLMEVTHMSASEIMRSAFLLQIERFNGTGTISDSNL